jgi:hypothetical protein
MAAFFILQSDVPDTSRRVVISADAKEIATLIGMLWGLIDGRYNEVHLSTLGSFEAINLAEIIFVRSQISYLDFDGARLKFQADKAHLQNYASLLESLISAYNRHQHLDSATSDGDIELVVSIGEYPTAFIEKLKRQPARGH